MPKFDFINNLYEEVSRYEILSQKASLTDKYRLEYTKNILKNYIAKNDNIKILEIGPGSGYISKEISNIISDYKNIEFDILDFSDGFVEVVKKLEINISNTYVADLSSTEFEVEKKYDLVFFQEVLEHTVCPFVALFNINKLIKQDGVLALTVPNSNYYKDLINTTRVLKRKKLLNTHIAKLSPIGVLKILSMSGFEIENFHFYATKLKDISYINSFFSSEFGVIAKKVSLPKDKWQELTKEIVKTWIK